MSKVFCNVPWKEVHINADGTYHSCGAQPNKISGSIDAGTYNVFKMTIPEWINSQHQIYSRRIIASLLCQPASAASLLQHQFYVHEMFCSCNLFEVCEILVLCVLVMLSFNAINWSRKLFLSQ